MSSGSDVYQISIAWNQPSIPNGVIIMYEIRYRESDNNDSFIFMNGTTNTQHIIDGLLPNTSYTVGVRAYTIAGPGEWTDITAVTMSSESGMSKKLLVYNLCWYAQCIHTFIQGYVNIVLTDRHIDLFLLLLLSCSLYPLYTVNFQFTRYSLLFIKHCPSLLLLSPYSYV